MNMNEADQTNSLILKLKDNLIRFSLLIKKLRSGELLVEYTKYKNR